MRFAALALALLATTGVSACKVVSIAEDQAMRARSSSDFDAGGYAEALWGEQALPYWRAAQQDIVELAPRLRSDLEAAGAAHGRQAGDGSPWTFVVAGEGVVRSIAPGRRGRVTVALPGVSETLIIQTGPVVSGTSLRDSLPFVQFNDFANQLVYADVAQALTEAAVARTSPATHGLAEGDTIRFAGVVAVAAPGDPLILTPYSLSRGAS